MTKDKPIKKLEVVTEQEYMEIQDRILGEYAQYTQRLAEQFGDIREVVELISGLGGTIAFYKKETDTQIIYDYAISMPVGWDYEDFFGE